ncbi:hypothetical protein ACH9EU_05695 [Kocuria sp. M1R5S2]|uniref:hypothetical protein n=1 Tax=Kocuria rhizosphaerae TaxID=3376285 RepID=UPI0037B2DE97
MTDRPSATTRLRGPKPAGWVTVAVLALVVIASVFYAAGVPWARTGLDAFWAWFDGSLDRLQVMSWVTAAVVAVVSYRRYLVERSAQQLEQARWAADKATSANEQQRRVASQAINDLEESAEARGEQLPSFVEEVKETLRSDIIDSVVADTEAIRAIREDDVDHQDAPDVDGHDEGKR